MSGFPLSRAAYRLLASLAVACVSLVGPFLPGDWFS